MKKTVGQNLQDEESTPDRKIRPRQRNPQEYQEGQGDLESEAFGEASGEETDNESEQNYPEIDVNTPSGDEEEEDDGDDTEKIPAAWVLQINKLKFVEQLLKILLFIT
uniref:Uncharacterized protein n=1 Tax=Trichogramma kaykai TaxID=54128 RepID=A0ABD2VUH4_9HYME